LQALSAEYEGLQSHQEKLVENEKRAWGEVDRVKNELNAAQQSHTDTQHQLNTEVATLRRELQDLRGKAKIVLESKTRVEMELINVRGDLGKMEMEAHKQSVTVKESEATQRALEESLQSMQHTVQNQTENMNRLKNTISELEDAVQRKNSNIDSLKDELVHLEREGLLEIRRLR
jgi:chromosome segregation ATPase